MTDEFGQLAAQLSDADASELEAFLQAAGDRKLLLEAQDDFLTFAKLMNPHREDRHDLSKTSYMVGVHHKLIAEMLMRCETGELTNLIVVMPPRHGKSESVTRLFPAWAMGRDPEREFIITGYSQKFAEKSFGKKIRAIMDSPRYRAVFSDAEFGLSKASDVMIMEAGGQFVMSGRDGSLTGHGADFLIIDDPVKNAKEADSEIIMDDIWDWFLTTAQTRLYPTGVTIIVMTRWSEDDLVGRLTNPEHPAYRADVAKQWKILHFPAVFEDEHKDIGRVIGKQVGDCLWPERGFDKSYFAPRRKQDARVWSALYQGSPAPLEGDFFRSQWIQEYESSTLPDLQYFNFYGASDHGVTTKRQSDPSVIGCVGVDEYGNAYVMPDLVWERLATDKIVDELIAKMQYYKPLVWWIESENIAKAFGPFLMKRMAEENCYDTVIDPRPPSHDKAARAQSVRGLMAHGKVFFPRDAYWWPSAKKQLLTFPNGTAFDFVDWLSWIGQGVMELIPGKSQAQGDVDPKDIPFTLAWLKEQSRQEKRRERRNEAARIGY